MARDFSANRSFGLVLALAVGAICLGLALMVSNMQSQIALLATLGLVIVAIAFLMPEVGLYILLISMLLSPEVIAGGLGGGGATTSRGITLRLDDFLLLLLAVAWIGRSAVYKDLVLFRKSSLNGPIAAYIALAFISTAFGVLFDRVRAVVGFMYVLKYAEYMVVYFATVSFIQDRRHLRNLIYVAFFTALVVSLYGIAQIPMGVRVSAPFEGQTGEPNTMGGYLLLILAIFGGILVSAPGLRTAMRYAIGIGVLTIPFIYTLSRASYLGLVVTAPVILFLSRRKAITAFALFTLLLAMMLAAPEAMVERLRYTVGGQGPAAGQVALGGVRLDTSTSARLQTYGDVLTDFVKQPIFGYGVTGYGFIDGQYPRLLIEMGLLGLGVFFWLIYTLFQQAIGALRAVRGWWERGIVIGYIAGLAGLLMHAAGSNTFIIVRIMEPFWFFTGVIVLFQTLPPEEGEDEETAPEEVRSVSHGLISPV